jgi:hypothetical protein
MTGLEIADVIALAQHGSGVRLAASTGPDQKRYRTLRDPKATFPVGVTAGR